MRAELHLLRKIEGIPAGVKLPIGPLSREMSQSQAVTLDMVARLVAEGRLDRQTLRPSAPMPRAPTRVDAAEILPEIRQFLRETGWGKCRFGKDCLNDTAAVGLMESGARRTILSSTAERIRAFIRNNRGTSGDEGGGRERAPAVGLANGSADERERRTPDTAASTCVREGEPRAGAKLPSAPNPALHAQRTRQRQEREATARLDAGLPGRNTFERNLMCDITRRRETETRLGDRVEQARAALRKRFAPVVAAEYADPPGPKGHYLVGRKIVTELELLDMAGLS